MNFLQIIVIILLIPIVYTDIKYRKIRNRYLIGVIVLRLLILVCSIIYIQENYWVKIGNKKIFDLIIEFSWSLISSLGFIFLVFVYIKILKKLDKIQTFSLGMGDIKLFAVLLLYLELNNFLAIIFCAGLIAIVCQVIKKKIFSKKGNESLLKISLPLAPYIFLGSIFVNGLVISI
ncbi:MAG: prepilin peptidase [Candidatus Ancillula sp.]|jgi:Flp pilus assembly protein protease CpaA|nr:prepilin peptidase [Candidatus Ancillula sp.]